MHLNLNAPVFLSYGDYLLFLRERKKKQYYDKWTSFTEWKWSVEKQSIRVAP